MHFFNPVWSLALVELMGSDHPASKSFTKRYEAMVRSRSEQLRKREEALSVLGWTRQ
jgi:3-hydroxyacyl-CoA dehydrogenase